MKNQRLEVLQMVADKQISIEEANDKLLGLSNVVESLLTCPKCKDYYGHDINRKCFNCGTKLHSQ